MALIDKLLANDDKKIPIHSFIGGLVLWANGIWNRATLISKYNLETSDEVQLDVLKAKFDGIADKRKFREIVVSLLYQGEEGKMTKAEIIAEFQNL